MKLLPKGENSAFCDIEEACSIANTSRTNIHNVLKRYDVESFNFRRNTFVRREELIRAVEQRDEYYGRPNIIPTESQFTAHMAVYRFMFRSMGVDPIFTLTHNEWVDLCAKYGNRCLCCGNSVKLTIDHIVPVSKGGTHTVDNIQPLCIRCNVSKFQKTTNYRAAIDLLQLSA